MSTHHVLLQKTNTPSTELCHGLCYQELHRRISCNNGYSGADNQAIHGEHMSSRDGCVGIFMHNQAGVYTRRQTGICENALRILVPSSLFASSGYQE